jgi:signal transduction histidine kinase
MSAQPRTPSPDPAGPHPEPGTISIRRRVYLLMAVGILIPVVIIGAAGLWWLRALDARMLAGRVAAAGAVAAHLDAALTDDLEVLQRLGVAFGKPLQDHDVAPIERALRESHHQQVRTREALFVLDAKRRLVAEEPEGAVEGLADAGPLLDEVIATGRPRLSGTHAGPRGPEIHELMPIRSWRGDVIGVVGATFRPDRRDFERMLRFLQRGATGVVDLVDGTGAVVASTDAGRAGHRVECAKRMVQLAQEKRPVSVLCADCHDEHGVELRPAQHLTFAALGAAPWGVVVRQEAAEALPTHGALPWFVVVGVLGLHFAIAGVFAWGAARSVTGPVGVLTQHAERIAAGELATPIPDLGGDEIGRLGRSLDRMRQSLRESLDRVAQANAGLERRVADRTRELAEANEALREREQARSQLLRKLITVQEDERKRIARELHDETTQTLAVLAMGLEAAQEAVRAGKVPRLEEVKALAVRTLEEVHRLIVDLRPSVLDDLGLLSAVRWYAERTLEKRGVSVRCEFGEMPALAPELETALFRICQEMLTNVARHAKASAVLVQVGAEDGAISVDVEDDGQGFDPEAVARREGRRPWGLMGIRERVEILGGTIRIESAPGSGTHVEIRIPAPRAAPAEPAATPTEEQAR